MRNEQFLQNTLKGLQTDYLYHLGLTSRSYELNLMKNIKNVVMAGSPDRIKRMAKRYGVGFRFPKTERFLAEYVDDTLFISHGMGMASSSICLQEILKLVYYIKDGDMNKVNDVFICRVGTSGGFGVPPGTVVVTNKAFNADMEPYSLRGSSYSYDDTLRYNNTFPKSVIGGILLANDNIDSIEVGNTVSCDDFYLEQMRSDGATIRDKVGLEKDTAFEDFRRNGIKNMEMEAAMIAAVCNDFGHRNFATICCTLVDRFKSDQVTSTPEELAEFSVRAEDVVFNYLEYRKNEKVEEEISTLVDGHGPQAKG